MQHLGDLQNTACCWSPEAPREAEDLAIILSIYASALTYLAYCNQLVINLKFVFIHVNIAKVLLVVKTLIKKILTFFGSVLSLNPLDRIRLSSRSATTLFSSHESIKQQLH